jgi:hypothetical protein
VEHNISPQQQPSQRARRPDLSTFFSTLELVDTSGEHQTHVNPHALPQPGDVAAAFRTLANAFEVMRVESSSASGSGENQLLATLIENLMSSADNPPKEVHIVPDSFLDELERVPKTNLKQSQSCPICNNPFLDGMFPTRLATADIFLD